MSAPSAVILGTGRMAGGFVAPMLASAGWSVTLLGRDPQIVEALRAHRRIRLYSGSPPHGGQLVAEVEGVTAASIATTALEDAMERADLVATAVGPESLTEMGRRIAPALLRRVRHGRPVNVIASENHRRAPELLAAGLLDAAPELADAIGTVIGLAGAAVWRAIASRRLEADAVAYEIDLEAEAHVDGHALVAGCPPADGSVPGLTLSSRFDDRMVEKLWVFNAGHAAAAYHGWLAGCATIAEAVERPAVQKRVVAVVDEARAAFEAHQLARTGVVAISPRPALAVLARYADPALADPVQRVAREPRRKLAPGDRLIGPALALMADGHRPLALAEAAAAALAYADATDRQAMDLQLELRHLGPAEVLAATTGLDACDELSHMIVSAWTEATAVRPALQAGGVGR